MIALLLSTLPVSFSETLKQLLLSQAIPLDKFQQTELEEDVHATFSKEDAIVFFAYKQMKNQVLSGPIHLVSYDSSSTTVIRRDLELDPTDVCSGSLWGVSFVEDFILLSTDISPSAVCTHVLDKNLRLRRTLYGFSPGLVAPEQVVIIENMIHFAPVHPERLQLSDLHTGSTVELYPPKGDALRAQLAAENARHMPSRQVCAQMNDPCDPKVFDESIGAFGTDGHGRFAFIASQSASHATQNEEPPETFAAQSVLYVYSHNLNGGWSYCQQALKDLDVKLLISAQKLRFEEASSRCTPNLPVIPDMSTATYNPFLNP